jgi:hypothetical protein
VSGERNVSEILKKANFSQHNKEVPFALTFTREITYKWPSHFCSLLCFIPFLPMHSVCSAHLIGTLILFCRNCCLALKMQIQVNEDLWSNFILILSFWQHEYKTTLSILQIRKLMLLYKMCMRNMFSLNCNQWPSSDFWAGCILLLP